MNRLQRLERIDVGHFLGRIAATGREGYRNVVSGRFRGPLDADVAGEYDHVGDAGAGIGRDALEHAKHLRETLGLVAFPVLLRCETNARAVGAAAIVGAAEGAGAVPRGRDHFAHAEAAGLDLRLDRSDVVIRAARGNGILPDQVFSRHVGAEVTRLRAHVAVGQLEPGPREGVPEILGIGAKPVHDLAIGRVHLHRHVGVGHHGVVADRRILGVDRLVLFGDLDRLPLPRAGGALFQLPLVIEQHVEIAHVEHGRVGGPGAFQAAGYRIAADTASGLVEPAETLVFEAAALGFRAQ